MTNNEFFTRVNDEVASCMSEYHISVREITKNNGLILHGLIASRKESKIAPTIYLEHYHELYEEGTSLTEIVNELTRVIKEHSGEGIDVDYFMDYEQVKDRIVFKLINHELNEKMLETVPYVPWNDLAVVFCHVCEDIDSGYATILINNEHLKMWGITCRELFDQAVINTPRVMTDELSTMDSILSKMTGIDLSNEDEEGNGAACNMYVLTNKKRLFGASCLLYSSRLKSLSSRYGCGLYILPSSIHEVIILPKNGIDDAGYLKSMIREVNETQVSPEERLSDNLYYYDPGMDEITLATA